MNVAVQIEPLKGYTITSTFAAATLFLSPTCTIQIHSCYLGLRPRLEHLQDRVNIYEPFSGQINCLKRYVYSYQILSEIETSTRHARQIKLKSRIKFAPLLLGPPQ